MKSAAASTSNSNSYSTFVGVSGTHTIDQTRAVSLMHARRQKEATRDRNRGVLQSLKSASETDIVKCQVRSSERQDTGWTGSKVADSDKTV